MSHRSQAEDLFFNALEIAASADRFAYLEQACAGDDALLRRVAGLLAAHERVGSFLDRPVSEALGVAPLDLAAVDLSFLDPPREPGALGHLDQYTVLEVIGCGGTGIVFRALDTKLSRVVAIKTLAIAFAGSVAARQRFIREARAAAAVRDDHVVAIHAVEDQGSVPYLAMEFIDGQNLESLVRENGPLEVIDVLRIGIQVASGLAAAHRLGLVHRDVKPANILLENGIRRVKLTDFGLARAVDDASLTNPGQIAGTPMYMSPEQANGEPIDHRSDLFSLGSVLYELCAGRPPFQAPNTAAVLRRVAEEPAPTINDVNPGIPVALCQLISRLHAKSPADRPASAREVADSLMRMHAETQAHGATALPTPEPRPVVAKTYWSARRWLPAAAAVLLLLAGLGIGEATGVTDVSGTVFRLLSPAGTLVVEIDDPRVSVVVEGPDVVITGSGVKEIRLKPGSYTLAASKDGKPLHQELVTVTRDGRRVVRISNETEPLSESQAWESSVAALPPDKQVEAVAERLKQLNPGFDGAVASTTRDSMVIGLKFNTNAVADLSPVRALRHLEVLHCFGASERQGILADLSPLRGIPLRALHVEDNPVTDLSPLEGMPLHELGLFRTQVADLTPLRGLPLVSLGIGNTRITELSTLRGMKLTHLYCDLTAVSDLAPLEGMPLEALYVPSTRVADLSPLRGMALNELSIDHTLVNDLSVLKGMPLKVLHCNFERERDAEILRTLTTLETINGRPAAEFWDNAGDE